MDMKEVYWCNQKVGEVSMEKSGLYHLVKCRCQLSYGPIYRLLAVVDGQNVDLGILIPQNGAFQLTKKLPVKLLGKGCTQFQITNNSVKRKDNYLSVDPLKPFLHLSEVSNAKFTREGGKYGIILLG